MSSSSSSLSDSSRREGRSGYSSEAGSSVGVTKTDWPRQLLGCWRKVTSAPAHAVDGCVVSRSESSMRMEGFLPDLAHLPTMSGGRRVEGLQTNDVVKDKDYQKWTRVHQMQTCGWNFSFPPHILIQGHFNRLSPTRDNWYTLSGQYVLCQSLSIFKILTMTGIP